MENSIKCPKCGRSNYKELYDMATAMYCIPIYESDVQINSNQNYCTTECSCLNCGSRFSICNHNGEEEITLLN